MPSSEYERHEVAEWNVASEVTDDADACISGDEWCDDIGGGYGVTCSVREAAAAPGGVLGIINGSSRGAGAGGAGWRSTGGSSSVRSMVIGSGGGNGCVSGS